MNIHEIVRYLIIQEAKKYFLTLLAITTLILGSGCAHATIHEICSKPDGVVTRYQDYNQCYAEESASRNRKRKGWATAFNSMGKQKSYQCYSSTSAGSTSTRCY